MNEITTRGTGCGLPGSRAGAAVWMGVLCVLSGVSLTACKDFLTAENPSEILATDLQDPKALPILINGVAGDYDYMYSYAIVTLGYFSNELWHTGSSSDWRELETGLADPSGAMGTTYDRAVKANWTADNAANLILDAISDAKSRPELAKARTYAGYAQLLLADNFCQVTVGGGPAQTPQAVYGLALANFAEAVSVATTANDAVEKLKALAGRARANLMLGTYQAARDDARQIPAGWSFQAIYSLNSSREENFIPSQTVAKFRKEGGVDPAYYNDAMYANDPRLSFINKGESFKGEDRIRQFVEQTKYPERESPAPIANWQEARLIEAEAELQLGNTTRAIALINELRTRVGVALPAYSGLATETAVMDQILFERSVELYLQAQHLVDRRRSGDPSLGGRENCGQISWNEAQSNPNVR